MRVTTSPLAIVRVLHGAMDIPAQLTGKQD